jgi:NAD(P)-dependent dehydrogenase (short-subunit alcohol dehydrogenase family)
MAVLIENASVDRNALRGSVAIVTGAGQGIGRETARALAHLGAAVVIAEIADGGQETESLIRSAGGRALFVRADVADPTSLRELHRRALDEFGPVDVLINNAEVNCAKSVLEHTVEEWDRVVAVNLRAIFLGAKEFLPAMLERRRGVVVTMPSAEGMPYLSAYLAAKVGVRSLTMSLAQEIGDAAGVSVYCFGAGMVATEGGLAAFAELAPRYGLTLDEFIAQSGGRLIAPDLCAAGLVGTILHAGQFHGQLTGHGEGLALLGLDADGQPAEETPTPAAEPEPPAPAAVAPASGVAAVLALNRELEAVLATIDREFAELTLFQRPIVKRMFQQGTGRKVEDWRSRASALTETLARSGPAGVGAAILASYVADLGRLAEYNARLEPQARGYLKGEKLDAALVALRERRMVAERLAVALGGPTVRS